MTAHLHADAVRLLTGWEAPDQGQDDLRHAYLAFLGGRDDACSRACAPGHLTASAFVLSHDLTRVALLLHKRVGSWLPPGGHLEPADASLADAAQRELLEETGLAVSLDPAPLLLSCHPITCRGYTEPTRHLDVCFTGRADADAQLAVSDESHDLRWWRTDALPGVVLRRVRAEVGRAVDRYARPSGRVP